jgi:hypothetical protein
MPGGAPRQDDRLEGIEQDDEQASDASNKCQYPHDFPPGKCSLTRAF